MARGFNKPTHERNPGKTVRWEDGTSQRSGKTPGGRKYYAVKGPDGKAVDVGGYRKSSGTLGSGKSFNGKSVKKGPTKPVGAKKKSK